MANSSRVRLWRWTAIDPFLLPLRELRRAAARLTASQREQLLLLADSILSKPRSCASKENRVSAVKTLIALLPESAEVIERWLRERTISRAYEVQFTLFCFLDEVARLDALRRFRARVLALVEEYLAAVASESGYAAWMAGDLLGDHWPISESLPALSRLVTRAEYPAGRKGAIHGLSHILQNNVVSPLEKPQIVKLLQRASKKDVDEGVRKYAKHVLRGLW